VRSNAGPLGAFGAAGPSHTFGTRLGTNVLEAMRDALVTALLLLGHGILTTRGMAHEILFPFGTLAHAMLFQLMSLARFLAVLDYLALFAHLVACAFRFVLQAFQEAASGAMFAHRAAFPARIAELFLRFGTALGTTGTARTVFALALLGTIADAALADLVLPEARFGLGATLAAYLRSTMRAAGRAPDTKFLGCATLGL